MAPIYFRITSFFSWKNINPNPPSPVYIRLWIQNIFKGWPHVPLIVFSLVEPCNQCWLEILRGHGQLPLLPCPSAGAARNRDGLYTKIIQLSRDRMLKTDWYYNCFFQNFLNNFPSTDMFSIFARVFLFFQLLTVYPLISYMLRVQVFAALELSIYPSVLHVIALNCFVIFICILFAIFMPHIGTVIR